jgi:hypothetical protein
MLLNKKLYYEKVNHSSGQNVTWNGITCQHPYNIRKLLKKFSGTGAK